MSKNERFIKAESIAEKISVINDRTYAYCCISYLIGEVMTHRVEECGLYQLNYEAVLYLLLADMTASDFLEKYQRKGRGKAA